MRVTHTPRIALVAIVAATVAVTGCQRTESVPPPPGFAGMQLVPPRAKPDFTLTDVNGRPFAFRASTNGYLTLLFLGYTHCPDVCPLQMANIATVMRQLSPEQRARMRVVFVTTDPEHDTPEKLKVWLANFDSTFIGLHGPLDAIHRIEASLSMEPSFKESNGVDYGIGHAAQVLAFTPDDSLRLEYPMGVQQKDWVADIPKLLAFGKNR